MFQISDSDIEHIEKILLPLGCSFNEERRAFIRCLKSRDVVACPGSGKTTALLAKILILASKMPFQDGRGICVLTHTNVGINEIKKRLGDGADHLFRHPNFFGTIQAFVNRFLAIPGYKQEYGKGLQFIDSDVYYAKIKSLYAKNQRKLYWLKNRGEADTLGGYWFEPDELHIVKNWNAPNIGVGRHTKTYKAIYNIRHEILKNGILSYNDAYTIALRHINFHPSIIEAFCFRFAYIFIDEMQDTDSHQIKILEKIFDKTRQVVQRLGDPNQAIYSKARKEMVWAPSLYALHFSDSCRFGTNITKILCTVRVDPQIELKENPKQNSLPFHLLSYTDETISQVLKGFAFLIKKYGLNNLNDIKDPIFKAVGWIGKDKTKEGKLCLRSYLPTYQKSIQNNKRYFTNLLSYLHAAVMYGEAVSNVKVYLEYLRNAVLRVLAIGGMKNPESGQSFTSQTFRRWLRYEKPTAYAELQQKMSVWIMELRTINNIHEVREEIIKYLNSAEWIQLKNGEKVKAFLKENSLEVQIDEEQPVNIFKDDESGIEIKVATVHSVKGETHTATLYLDTYYQKKVDSERIMEFLEGNFSEDETRRAYHIENLKIAHVAFSRPSHLLAFACHEDKLNGHIKNLKKNGWKIVSVSSLLQDDDAEEKK